MSNRARYRRFAEKVDDHDLIFNIVKETFEKLDEPLVDSEGSKNVQVIWSNHLKTTAGTASRKTVITLSNILWERATLEQRKEVVTHEACHLVVQRKRLKIVGHGSYFGTYQDDEERDNYRAHGEAWKFAMRICGYINPRRCHTIKPVRRLFLYVCSCTPIESGGHKIKIRLHNRFMRKEIYGIICKKCGNMCTFVKEIKE